MTTTLDRKLEKISKGLLEDFHSYHSAGDFISHEIFKVLRFQSKNEIFELSRVKLAGCCGKRTSLGTSNQPDFEIIIFVNHEEPPFDELLHKFEEMLDRNYKGTGVYIYEKTTSHSLQFKLQVTDYNSEFRGMYISFELLPAVNLLYPEDDVLPGFQRDRMQVEKTLRDISELEYPEQEWKLYSSGLCERGISFVRDQSDFVQDNIRLAKLWNKKVNYDEIICGRSMIIELVAIYAALEEEEDADTEERPESIAKAFEIFLKKFINFDRNMWVCFDYQTNPNQWRPYEIYLRQRELRPLILDPVNPYNNLAEDLSPWAKIAFANHAKRTLKDFNEWGIDYYFQD